MTADEYTPTTDEITRYYIDGSRDWFPGLTASERNERFDRWLAGEHARVLRDQALRAARAAADAAYDAVVGQGMTADTVHCGATWDVRERTSEYAGLHRCALPAGHGGPHVEATRGWRWNRADAEEADRDR